MSRHTRWTGPRGLGKEKEVPSTLKNHVPRPPQGKPSAHKVCLPYLERFADFLGWTLPLAWEDTYQLTSEREQGLGALARGKGTEMSHGMKGRWTNS